MRKKELLIALAAIVLVIGHFVFLMAFFRGAASGADAHGYTLQARLIATEGRTWYRPEQPLQYTGMHWLKTDDGRRVSRYPAGLPAMMAAAFRLFGPTAALLVNPLMASLSLLGVFLLCRRWVGSGWALAAMAATAVNPQLNEHALSGFAHAPIAFLLIWGAYLLDLWAEHHRVWLAALAGLLLGIIPTVRYPEAVYAIGLGLFIAMVLLNNRKLWAGALAAVGAAAIPTALIFIHNHRVYGAFWRTGYALTNEQTGFSWAYFRQHFAGYLQGIVSGGAPYFAALGVAGIVLWCSRKETRARALLFIGILVPTTLVYMFYYWAQGRNNAAMRFLIPTFPLYTIAGVYVLKLLAERMPRAAAATTCVLVLLTAGSGLPESLDMLARSARNDEANVKLAEFIRKNVPEGSVVVASGNSLQHLDYLGGYKLADLSALQGSRRGRGRGQRMFGGGDDGNRPNPRQSGGDAEAIERYQSGQSGRPALAALQDLQTWAGDAQAVYFVGNAEVIERIVPARQNVTEVAKEELPASHGMMGMMGGRMAMRGPMAPGGNMPGMGGGMMPGGPMPGNNAMGPDQGGPPPMGGPQDMGGPPGVGGPGGFDRSRAQSTEIVFIMKWTWRRPISEQGNRGTGGDRTRTYRPTDGGALPNRTSDERSRDDASANEFWLPPIENLRP